MINFNIGTFFDKFKNAAQREILTRQVIADSIEKVAGIRIDPKEIELKNKIITVRANPAAKNHIFMKKEDIIADIRGRLPVFIVSDLR